MPFELPQLPYKLNALEPYISKETLEYHYGKHHNAYISNLNKLLADGNTKAESLEEIILNSTGTIFNNAAQAWNHNFYWNCLIPTTNKNPTGPLLDAINSTFGNMNKFKEQFINMALTNFGSGWTWLVKNSDNSLSIINTSNANTPITDDKVALLTCDIWEHAYYIDYRNERNKYLNAFLEIINWDFAQNCFL